MRKTFKIFFFLFMISIHAQDSDDLDLLGKDDLDALENIDELNLDSPDKEDIKSSKQVEELETPKKQVKQNKTEVVNDDDDLEALKEDIGESLYEKSEESKQADQKESSKIDKKEEIVEEKSFELTGDESKKDTVQIFDVGEEESKLLELSKFIMGKIPEKDWSEIATSSKKEKYVVQKGDWLWKISQRLFGTGFYYSKIWALNPHITNPHEIEPGTVLVFSTGDEDEMPVVHLKKFERDESGKVKEIENKEVVINLKGNHPIPPWLIKRQQLIDQGVFFQFTSDTTYEDLNKAGLGYKSVEYKRYEPPVSLIAPTYVEKEVSETRGFDKSSKIDVNFVEGFYLTTFITSNIVQDLGELVASSSISNFITDYNQVFVNFDPSTKVRPGDYYSVYTANGKYAHPESERTGYRYTITAQIKALEPKDDLWKCEIVEISGIVERNSRITKYTPKIEKIVRTFSRRTIEGVVIGTTRDSQQGVSYGDVVFIDRGRMDGVENGTVFEIFSSVDEATGQDISIDPSYKIGELTVITLTDNFSTALVTNSSSLISLGVLAVSKSVESAAQVGKLGQKGLLKDIERVEGTLDDLDMELNIDEIGQDLLDKADNVELTDDEIEILERKEREQSVIRDHERDIQDLDRLESEIQEAEGLLNEAKVDEDKFLEQQDLNYVEKRSENPNEDAFESLDEVEKDLGLKFMDEDLNSKENPFGLTENDLEEVEELMDKEKDAVKK